MGTLGARRRDAALIAAIALGVIAAGLVYIAGRGTAPAPRPRAAGCAWYSPTTGGQMVIVSASGPACGDPPIVDWVASLTRATWYSTSYVAGTLLARLGRDGSTVRVYQVGSSRATGDRAGNLAGDLEGAGWAVEPP